MPWQPAEARRFTKKANTAKKRRQFSHVANSALKRGASEKSAIMQANAVVGRSGKHKSKRKGSKRR